MTFLTTLAGPPGRSSIDVRAASPGSLMSDVDFDRTITVPGRGVVAVEPDVAALRLGVAVVRPGASEARSAAAATMQAVLTAIAGAGVAPPDVRTALVGLDAVRDYSSPAGPVVTGYQLTNSVEATVRDVADVGAVIDAALAAGATSMDGLTFRLDDESAAREEARRRAFRDARARATTLAAEAEVRLGAVVGIVEGAAWAPGPPRPTAEMRMKAMADAATPVSPGTTELEVTIAVTFLVS